MPYSILQDSASPSIQDHANRGGSPAEKVSAIAGNRLTILSETPGVHRAVKMNLANEGLEAKRKEEETLSKKRKAEDDANWEGMPPRFLSCTSADSCVPATANREQRVGSWRSFAKGSKKKKKQKMELLG